MNIIGIIAEYNPFHKGHAYQIETLKNRIHADYVIIAMSGNFVQRGAPALADKYTRAQMALSCGADLVLELPALWSCASAEHFARGGVSLLANTGVVSHLGFGGECNDLSFLKKAADLLLKEPEPYQRMLRQKLKSGLSFPLARSMALTACLFEASDPDAANLCHALSYPNNILAVEYLKAISQYAPGLTPVLLQRKGQGYHDTNISQDFCSASAIRSWILKSPLDPESGQNILTEQLKHQLRFAMPDAACQLLFHYPAPFLFEDDFSALVHYKLLTENPDILSGYGDSSRDLANRMYHARHEYQSWTQFCGLLKSKNTTYTRISRLLLHLLLNIRKEDYGVSAIFKPVPYLRVLGFRKTASPLLSKIQQHSAVPLITSCSDALNTLGPDACQLLETDAAASDLYNLALTAKGAVGLFSDYRHPMVIL